jgi:16S rRNA (adenine1518-N6/adenine1519-N6)-dimethyltransferase
MRVKFRPQINADVADQELLWETVSAGFAQKRKTILNNLRHASGRLQEVLKRNGGASIVLCKAGIDLKRRAETLTVEEWARITSSQL